MDVNSQPVEAIDSLESYLLLNWSDRKSIRDKKESEMPKGYWINHVEEIIDQDAFGRYITAERAGRSR